MDKGRRRKSIVMPFPSFRQFLERRIPDFRREMGGFRFLEVRGDVHLEVREDVQIKEPRVVV